MNGIGHRAGNGRATEGQAKSTARSRSVVAINQSFSPAATADAVASVVSKSDPRFDPSLVCSVSYGGMEVSFVAFPDTQPDPTTASTIWQVVVVCEQSKTILQHLDLGELSVKEREVVALHVNQTSGILTVALAHGTIATYHPHQRRNPYRVERPYLWATGPAIECRHVFFPDEETTGPHVWTRPRSDSVSLSEGVVLSSSTNNRILVAHRDQIAVFGLCHGRLPTTYALVWTALTDAHIVAASISGDGEALAVATASCATVKLYRRDHEDGSDSHTLNQSVIHADRNTISTASDAGMLFKCDMVLEHSSDVTYVSFRGSGGNPKKENENTESNGNDYNTHDSQTEEGANTSTHISKDSMNFTATVNGNESFHDMDQDKTKNVSAVGSQDLLLTYCRSDLSVRIFAQGSGRELALWKTPPQTRVGWIQSMSKLNIGDLDPVKPGKPSSVSRAGKGQPNPVTNNSVPAHRSHNFTTNRQGALETGAWIGELTFNMTAFPALRLSRLCFVLRGTDEFEAVHLEEMTAVLPAGSLNPDAVMHSHGPIIRSTWSAWNAPPVAGGRQDDRDVSLVEGSAMSYLGLDSNETPSFLSGLPDGYPCEIHVVSAHPFAGKVTMLELPVFLDEDTLTAQIDDPKRWVLAVDETWNPKPNTESLPYGAGYLCASVGSNSRSIALTWRIEGEASGTISLDDTQSARSSLFPAHRSKTATIPKFVLDGSAIPVPICLPMLRLPKRTDIKAPESIQSVQWFPNNHHGEPPLLLVTTSQCRTYVFEIPPAWSSLEPQMPEFDPSGCSTNASAVGSDCNESGMDDNLSNYLHHSAPVGHSQGKSNHHHGHAQDEQDDQQDRRRDYDVLITPDPDFGIGLRLEAQKVEGSAAIAGSFKKHPLTGGRLPAERTGMIVLGDELLKVGTVNLEGMSFDEIISTVRNVGSSSSAGSPLRMRFRPGVAASADLQKPPSASPVSGPHSSIDTSATTSLSGTGTEVHRRSKAEILGLTTKQPKVLIDHGQHLDGAEKEFDSRSHATMLVGAEGEVQQQFGRVLGVCDGIVRRPRNEPHNVQLNRQQQDHPRPQRLHVVPWKGDIGGIVQSNRAALTIVVDGDSLSVGKLEILSDAGEPTVHFEALGSTALSTPATSQARDDVHSCDDQNLVEYMDTNSKGWWFFVADSGGSVQLVSVQVEGSNVRNGSTVVPSSPPTPSGNPEQQHCATFERYTVAMGLSGIRMIRHFRGEWFACLRTSNSLDRPLILEVWRLQPQHFVPADGSSDNKQDDSSLEPESELWSKGSIHPKGTVLDVQFVLSTHTDAVPLCVVLGHEAATCYTLDMVQKRWKESFSVEYPSPAGSLILSNSNKLRRTEIPLQCRENPLPAVPHLMELVRVCYREPVAVERPSSALPDWHPLPILTQICTAKDGVGAGIRELTPMLQWVGTNPEYLICMNDTTGRSSSTTPCGRFPTGYISTVPSFVGEDTDSPSTSTSETVQFLLDRQEQLSKEQSDNTTTKTELSMDMSMLRSILEVIKDQSAFAPLDRMGQLALFSIRLLVEGQNRSKSSVPSRRDPMPVSMPGHFLVKRKKAEPLRSRIPQLSSGGCIAAFQTRQQQALVDACRLPGQTFDWDTARLYRVPLWLRSTALLTKLAEEIGRTVYKKTRDIMQASLYFVATGNRNMLRNLAATDQSNTGRKFLTFISTHDFAGDRGRKAAEKNAYSLLRKQKYQSAATFFLLAQPPMVKPALEILVTKLGDLDLAMLVARLVESLPNGNDVASPSDGQFLATSQASLARLGSFGAVPSFGTSTPTGKTDSSSLVPSVPTGPHLSRLLKERAIPTADNAGDSCLVALLKLWIGRHRGAAFCLSKVSTGTSFSLSERATHPSDLVHRMNWIINTVSRLSLLVAIGASSKMIWLAASGLGALLIEQNLNKQASMILITYIREAKERLSNETKPQQGPSSNGNSNSTTVAVQPAPTQNGSQESSSIFDSFDVPAQAKKVPTKTEPAKASSIFDSFDVPAQARKPPTKTEPTSPGDKHLHTSSKSVSNEGQQQATIVQNEMDEDAKIFGDSYHQIPELWFEIQENTLQDATGKRLIRELCSHVGHYAVVDTDGHLSEDYGTKNTRTGYPSLVPFLNSPGNGKEFKTMVAKTVQSVGLVCQCETSAAIRWAFSLLENQDRSFSLVLRVLLFLSRGDTDKAIDIDDTVKEAALSLLHRCRVRAASDTFEEPDSVSTSDGLLQASLQLEFCLWLHRSGAIHLTAHAIRDATVAVRLGCIVAQWNEGIGCVSRLTASEPDCKVDFEAGRQLWSDFRLVARKHESELGHTKTSTGWEFLVDCNRDGATKMLKHRSPGTFIIRPHIEESGVFTLSFKTNLQVGNGAADRTASKKVKKDDVVQHAIIRLSDSGFRCGSFGPFSTLLKLLEAVSSSLPFDLLFDRPPHTGVVNDTLRSSPDAALLLEVLNDIERPKTELLVPDTDRPHQRRRNVGSSGRQPTLEMHTPPAAKSDLASFALLVAITEVRKQLSGIVAGASDSSDDERLTKSSETLNDSMDDLSSVGSLLSSPMDRHDNRSASRVLEAICSICRSFETSVLQRIAPLSRTNARNGGLGQPVTDSAHESQCADSKDAVDSENLLGIAPSKAVGDSIVRKLIQPQSKVDFRTLRVGEGEHSAMVVLCRRSDVVAWLVGSGTDATVETAQARLQDMERWRAIEAVAMPELSMKSNQATPEPKKKGDGSGCVMCYRFVDPWEVEVIESREGETQPAALGRQTFSPVDFAEVDRLVTDRLIRENPTTGIGAFWSSSRATVTLVRSLASVLPPWERGVGESVVSTTNENAIVGPTAFESSVRRHLYRNHQFAGLDIPLRFISLVQVELLDLKNLNNPSGGALSVFALLRLKRPGSSTPLSHKAKTLDSATTPPVKLTRVSGPNAPASWGSLVRFRFPLPEDVDVNGRSFNEDREALFRGAPSILQVSVYVKKFMSETLLGGADVSLDALSPGGQLEEWVPLRSPKDGINWFARIRLTLRFELMGLSQPDGLGGATDTIDSAGSRKILALSKLGGTYEDLAVRRSASTPDLLSYFEGIVY